MLNKKHMTRVFLNEKLLLKSMQPMLITVTISTVFIFPSIFCFIHKNQPEMFYGSVVNLSQRCFPFFCALLNIFVLRNYIEHYNCEIYFLYSKSKLQESVLMLFIYLTELLVPLFICSCIEKNMVFEFIRVMCQCTFFSALSYALMFITMSLPISLSVIFIYLMISIYNTSAYMKCFVFCSYEEMNAYNIWKTIVVLMISSLVMYIIGFLFNSFRCKNYINIP